MTASPRDVRFSLSSWVPAELAPTGATVGLKHPRDAMSFNFISLGVCRCHGRLHQGRALDNISDSVAPWCGICTNPDERYMRIGITRESMAKSNNTDMILPDQREFSNDRFEYIESHGVCVTATSFLILFVDTKRRLLVLGATRTYCTFAKSTEKFSIKNPGPKTGVQMHYAFASFSANSCSAAR